MNIIPSKLASFLDSMLEDNSGGYSTMRVLLVLVTCSVLTVWIHAAFTTPTRGVIPELPTNVLAFVGTFAAAKALQRFGEQAAVPQVIIPSITTTTTPTQ